MQHLRRNEETRGNDQRTTDHKLKLNILIDQRRNTQSSDSTTRARLSKDIRKELRTIKRISRRAEIETILQEYRSLKRISGIKARKEEYLITSMTILMESKNMNDNRLLMFSQPSTSNFTKTKTDKPRMRINHNLAKPHPAPQT